MGIEASIPCICSAVALTIDELVQLRMKMKENDGTVAMDLARLLENSKKYSKKDRKIIREYIRLWLEQNATVSNSEASLEEKKE